MLSMTELALSVHKTVFQPDSCNQEGSICQHQSMWAELSGENFRSPLTWVFAPPLHRSKSDQIAPLNSAPRSSTISSRSGEIAPRSLKFKITLHA